LAETHWNKLGAYLKETQILGSIQNTLYWDQNTGMPKKGASWRSEQLTYIAKVLHERNSSEKFSNLIQSAKNELADIERNSDNQLFIKDKERNISLLLKEFNRERNLDPKLVESLAKAKSKGMKAGKKLRKNQILKFFFLSLKN